MKRFLTILSCLLALLMLVGCAGQGTPTEDAAVTPANDKTTAAAETATPANDAASDTPEPAAETGTTAQPSTQSGEWEEEWPEEYPVENYRLEPGAIQQTGMLSGYRYQQLSGAETYMDLCADYTRAALNCSDALDMREDSPHDGYANWFMEAPNGNASVSGSSITGRFTYSLYPGFDRVLEVTDVQLDRVQMEQAAQEFVKRFSAITGELQLVQAEDTESYYYDERKDDWKDIAVPSIRYTFCSTDYSSLLLTLQPGVDAPVLCGDSSVPDLARHEFRVTVWPDGTVVWADNYITAAAAEYDRDYRMIDESDLPRLLEYLTSYAENDTVVFTSIRAEHFDVYFGSADIEPTLTVEYYFESDPDNPQSTEFAIGF